MGQDNTVPFVGPKEGDAPSRPPVAEDCVWVGRCASGWQFGEQGVIEALVDRLETAGVIREGVHRWVCEFGAGDGKEMPVTVANIARSAGWKALLIEGDALSAEVLARRFPDSTTVVPVKVDIEGENSIDRIAERAGFVSFVPDADGWTNDPAVMVIDVDSTEYHIFKSMRMQPLIVCIETRDLLSPSGSKLPDIPDPQDCGKFVGDWFGTMVQASAGATDQLMAEKGYRLVYRTRVNGIYIRWDMVKHIAKKCVVIGDTKLTGHENVADPEKLDYPDGSVDEVYAPGVLDKFPPEKTMDLIREWTRVLVPNGILRVSVPDMRKAITDIRTDGASINQQHVQRVVWGSGSKTGFVWESLSAKLYEANVGRVSDFTPFVPDGSTDRYSLNLMGTKRAFPKIENPRVCLILSQPRFSFTGHEKALILLAQKMKFDIQESTGSFWDRDITLATMNAIAKYNPDFLLYSDYDSIFEPSDVQTLLDTINADPTIAAIGAIQPSRHHDQPLVLDLTLDYTGDTTRVKFQHFGLTVIRREVFDELPQPWFWSVPGQDQNGEWDWNAFSRSDADITFWRNLDLLGLRVYQHNKVNIGHITQCVKYVRDSGKGVQLIPIENYWKHGKPKNAVFNADVYRKQEKK